MNEEQLRYLLQLINSGQGFNSGYQPPSILDVPTGSAQLAPGTGPGGQGILQSDVNQAIQTQPNVDVPPDIPAVSTPDMNQRFTDLMQLYTGNPSGFLASTDSAGQTNVDLPAANPAGTPTTAPELPPGLGGPGSYPADVTLPPGSGISIPSGEPLTFDDLTNLSNATGPGGTGNYPTSPDLTDTNRWEPTNQQVVDPQTGLPPPPATAVTDPGIIDPNDPNNNLTRGGVSMPLYTTPQGVFPGPTGGNFFTNAAGDLVDGTGRIIQAAGSFFRDAAGNLVNAAGNILQGAGGAVQNLGKNIAGSIPTNWGGFGQPMGFFGIPDQLPIGEFGAPGTINDIGSGQGTVANIGITPDDINASLSTPGSSQVTTAGAQSVQAPSGGMPVTGGTIGNLGSFSNMLGNEELMHVLKFGQLPTDAFGARAGTWTPALADYWRNVFNTRGYIYPPKTPGTAPPDASGATVSHTGVTQSR